MKETCMPPAPLDAIDRQLLSLLAKDGMTPLKKLAEACHISEATCSRRVARLEKNKTISRYVAVVDPKVLGQNVTVFVLLQFSTDQAAITQRLVKRLRETEELSALHNVSGTYDYLMELKLESVEAYKAFCAEYFDNEPLIYKYTTLFSLKAYA